MEYTRQQIRAAYDNLPEQVKEVLSSFDPIDAIRDIGAKYNLHLDQVGNLADEIGLVLFGLTKNYEFTDRIQTRLGLNRAQAEQITIDANTEIFLPIREFLKQSSGELPSREEVLQDIEKPPATLELEKPKATPPDTIFEQKMAKMFKLPREETPPSNPEIKDPYLEPPE
jgi:hypothetical protein